VVLIARRAARDWVQDVIPNNARCAGVILCRRGALMRAAEGNERPAAEQAHAADRFAREIVPFLTRFGGALAAADGQTVGPHFASAPSFEKHPAKLSVSRTMLQITFVDNARGHDDISVEFNNRQFTCDSYYCDVAGHTEAGMVGTLIVEP
jgi:hypothetical protein